jgi:hypothetical protein
MGTGTTFAVMAERCGLSPAEAARFLHVSEAVVHRWACGEAAPDSAMISELRALYRRIVHAGRELGEALRIRLEAQHTRHVEIGRVGEDGEAAACGFPSIGPHAAAVGIAIMLLPDDVTFELVPWRAGGPVPTAISLQADVVRAQLFDRRRKLEALERQLAGNGGANPNAAAAAERAVPNRPDTAELLALRSEIRELETLAKSTGVFAAGPRSARGAQRRGVIA